MNRRSLLSSLLLLCGLTPAQEPLWEISGNRVYYPGWSLAPFGDYDQDGCNDLVACVFGNYGTINAYAATRVISGRDGATLVELPPGGLSVQYAGDMDQDGSPDFAIVTAGPYAPPTRALQVWSPARNTMLWSVPRPNPSNYGEESGYLAGNLDVDGDGRLDLVAMTSQGRPEGAVYVYDNSGLLRYRLPVREFGWVPFAVAAMGDIDGDGGDDFIVGCGDPSARGAVVVVSGRTGSIIRISFGMQPGDVLGGAVANAGDVDGDGINDYAAASYWSSTYTSIVLFSGATGAVIRSWNDYWTGSGGMIGGLDADQDGVPDLVVGSGIMLAPNVFGQIRTYSGRDGTVLWNLSSTRNPNGSINSVEPGAIVNLGVQPGCPYPMIAWVEPIYYPSTLGVGRIRAFRWNRAGTGPVIGTSCASTGPPPLIGVRGVATGTRITLASAPPGALSWLLLSLAGQSSYGGQQLPLALDPFGLIGCTLYVAPAATASTVTGSAGLGSGYASFDLPLTIAPIGIFTNLAAQWIALDPTSLGVATTARHEFRVR